MRDERTIKLLGLKNIERTIHVRFTKKHSSYF